MGQSSTATRPTSKPKDRPELIYVNEQQEDPKISVELSENGTVRYGTSVSAEENSPKEEYYLQLYKPKFEHDYVVPPSARNLEMGDQGLQYICLQPWKIHTLSLGTSFLT